MEYHAYVQYDWNAVDPAELTVTEGQTVLVKDVNERGWALVFQEDTGLSGWVPNDYLRPLDENEIVEELAPVVVEDQPEFTQEQVQNAMHALQLASQPQQQQQQQPQPQANPNAQSCGACHKPIDGSALIAKGLHYHNDCFKCSVCQSLLTGGFLERDGKFFCEEDYYKSEGFVCTHCAQPIIGARIMGNGKPYHTDCLLCSVCNTSIGSDVLHVKDDKNVCHSCYNQHFAAICATCNLPIEHQIFSALDKNYHRECFVCFEGGHQMPDESFHAHEGHIYCPEHFKKLFAKKCHGCQEDITGQYLDVAGRFFHAEKCWKCTNCNCLLDSAGCSIKNDLFYCPTCVVKIPSNPQPAKAPSPTAAAAPPAAAKAPTPAAAPAPAAAPKAPVAAPAAAAKTPTPAPAPAPAPVAAKAASPQPTAAPAQKSTVGLLETLHAGGDDISTEEMRRRLLEISERALSEAGKDKSSDLYPVKDIYTHKELMDNERLPPSVNRAKKETYLSDEDFQSIFGMDKTKFAALKGWKQAELKKGAKIF